MTTMTTDSATTTPLTESPGHTPTPATDPGGAPVVHWLDPSPLEDWWTEVMDGAPAPAPRPGTTA